MNDNSKFNLIPRPFLLATDNKSDTGKAPTKPTDTPAVVSSVHATDEKAHTSSVKKITSPVTTSTTPAGPCTTGYHPTQAKEGIPNTTVAAESWNPVEDEKTEKMKAFFKDDEGPKVKFDGEEFNKDRLKYGFTKTLKDSRWAGPPKGNVTQEESRKEDQKSGSGGKPKGLKDSRWAK